MNSQVMWFVSRSSGIVAWVLVTMSICWGLFVSTKAVAKASSPAWLLDLHRYLGGLSIMFTGIHLAGLVGDNFVYFGWAELFVPMAADWKPGPVAFGIVGLYLLLAIQLTSLMMNHLPRRLWRWVHRSSFILYFVATYHAISAGTDRSNAWFRIAALASVNVIVFLTVVLILAIRRSKLVPSRQVGPRATMSS